MNERIKPCNDDPPLFYVLVCLLPGGPHCNSCDDESWSPASIMVPRSVEDLRGLIDMNLDIDSKCDQVAIAVWRDGRVATVRPEDGGAPAPEHAQEWCLSQWELVGQVLAQWIFSFAGRIRALSGGPHCN